MTPIIMKKPLTPQAMGRLGGLARAAKLTKAQRLASSRKANRAKAKKRGKV
jgi:hypothetical protein